MADRRIRVPRVVVGQTWSDDDVKICDRPPLVKVGEPWTPDDCDLSDTRRQDSQTRVAIGLALFFAALVLSITLYSMLVRDGPMLEHMAGFATTGMLAVLAWACGSHILKIVSGVRFDDRDAR